MALERETSDGVFETTVGDFPALIFVELMIDSDKGGVGIGEEVDFDDSAEDPAFILMIAVNNHVFLEFIFINVLIAAEVSAHKVIEVIY